MANRSRWLVAVLAVAVVAPLGRGDSIPTWRPYRVLAPGGQYVFVMLDPLNPKGTANWAEPSEGVREPDRPYPWSGLYRNDGSAEPVWTVDGYASQNLVSVTSDGTHFVRIYGWVKSSDEKAIEFFASGKPLRSYTYRELVGDSLDRLPRTVSGSLPASIYPGGRLDDPRQEFELEVNGDRFVFDIRTGEVVSEPLAPRLIRWSWWVGLGVVVVAVAWVAVRWRSRRRKARQAEPVAAPDPAT